MGNGKLAIAYAHGKDVPGYFMSSMMLALDHDWKHRQLIKGRVITIFSGPTIDRARNQMVELFLEHPDEPEWLLMVDSDMVFEPDAFYRILDAAHPTERPVVGGLCFATTGLGGVWPTMIQVTDKGIQHVREYPANTLYQVDGTGAAFMIIHRSVLERVKVEMGDNHPAPWFAYSYFGHLPVGEDIAFCLKLMKMQIPVYVHTGIKIGHLKYRTLDENEFFRVRQEYEDKRPYNYIVIPVYNRLDMTQRLVNQLSEWGGFERCFVFDNGSTDDTWEWLGTLDDRFTVLQRPEANIYQMWNEGWHLAKQESDGRMFNVCFMNNDIFFLTDFPVRDLDFALRGSGMDTWVVSPVIARQGTNPKSLKRDKGKLEVTMTPLGYCFMVKGEIPIRFDERYRWWFGDTDFWKQLEANKKRAGFVHSCFVVHGDEGKEQMSSSMNPDDPKCQRLASAAVREDYDRFAKRWKIQTTLLRDPFGKEVSHART